MLDKGRHGYFPFFINSCSPILLIVAVLKLAWSSPTLKPRENGECPTSYGNHPILIVSLDGFRADYLERELTPTIQDLADRGVHTRYMKTSYPTLTFPNHYTAVTGAYPEFHGIVSNEFYDPVLNDSFYLGKESSHDGKWWGAEPIWNTVTNQGKISATCFWPGSDAEIDGKHPTYWLPYNQSTPFEDRVDQVLEWLQLPKETRPSWVGLYFHEPDEAGHWYGPASKEVDKQLMIVDLMLKRLLDGFEEAGILSCVNIILQADHGMSRSGKDYVIHPQEFAPNITELGKVAQGSFPRIKLNEESKDLKSVLMEQLSCKNHFLKVYEKEGLPTRFHYSNNPRIEDIILDIAPGHTVMVDSDFYRAGEHGYDNYFRKMSALFVASGPAFKGGVEIEPFQNIELYNLMCHLAGVKPSPNNGTQGLMYHILKDPPEDPILPYESEPPTAEFPDENDIESLLNIASCHGDLSKPEEWLYSMNLTESEQENLKAYHTPWGIPHIGELPANLTLLYHTDHITAYSETLKMPLWTSFSIQGATESTPPAPWSSDIRLDPDYTIKCADYERLIARNITMAPLFPPAMSANRSMERIPYLVSNAVPINSQMEGRWKQLIEDIIPTWSIVWGPLNVIMGPLFDNDADSHVDNFEEFVITPEVPSDLFVVVTRCLLTEISVDHCPHDHLDVFSFIYSLYEPVSNCLDEERYALEFSAKVHDVELATGLMFYPDLAFRERVKLQVRITTDLWPLN